MKKDVQVHLGRWLGVVFNYIKLMGVTLSNNKLIIMINYN